MPDPIYRANDGSDHDTSEEAEKRNAILRAFDGMREAERACHFALNDAAVTADGKKLADLPPLCGLWTIGYRPDVVGTDGSCSPYLVEIDRPGYHSPRPFLHFEDGALSIEVEIDGKLIRFEMSSVYASRNAALAILSVEVSTWIGWQLSDLGELLGDSSEARLITGAVRAVCDVRYPNPVPMAVAAIQQAANEGERVVALLEALKSLGAGEIAEAYIQGRTS